MCGTTGPLCFVFAWRPWSLALLCAAITLSPGKKIRVKCNPDDTIADLKKLIAAQTGTRAEKLRLQKWYTVYKDHITLAYVIYVSIVMVTVG